MAVPGLWSCSSGSGGFMGSTLSDMCYRTVTERALQRRQLPFRQGSWPIRIKRLRLDHLCNGGFFLRYYVLGKRSIGEGLGHGLALVQHPEQEVLQYLAFVCICRIDWNQQPGKAGDRVSVLARRIGNGDTKVIRHFHP